VGVPVPIDSLGRPLGVLRLSLTALCNLACPYCCPDTQEPTGLLTLKQRVKLVEAFVALGGHTLRLTGGEPLLYPDLDPLIRALQPLKQSNSPAALRDIALTTNGVLLTKQRAIQLRSAGLDRITLSLDGTTSSAVARMAGLRGGDAAGQIVLNKVLSAIDHARNAGFDPGRGQIKLNAVMTRSGNADQLLGLAALARERGLELRLIEFMDVGNRNGWSPDTVLTAEEMVQIVGQRWPLEPLERQPHGTTLRWRYRDGQGRLSVIASITSPFCGDCNRLRVTADGKAYTCLFATPESGVDLRPFLLDADGQPDALRNHLSALWGQRHDRYSEERTEQRALDPAGQSMDSRAEMAYLGG
tara:strand:+ start:994 stop:2067 length:1074 start_codon:yes stop_codon:yes gene_type:complete